MEWSGELGNAFYGQDMAICSCQLRADVVSCSRSSQLKFLAWMGEGLLAILDDSWEREDLYSLWHGQ